MDDLIEQLIRGPERLLRDWMAMQILLRRSGDRYYVVCVRATGRRAFASRVHELHRAVLLTADSAGDAVELATDALLPPGTWHIVGTEIRDCGDVLQLPSVDRSIEVLQNYKSVGVDVCPALPNHSRTARAMV